MAALGGCWWPIEITPGWMQTIAGFLPTGWAMDAMHRLISFQAGAASAVPNLLALLAGSAIFGWIAKRTFRFE
jgi:ABC-type multidrug transport system permease subunit